MKINNIGWMNTTSKVLVAVLDDGGTISFMATYHECQKANGRGSSQGIIFHSNEPIAKYSGPKGAFWKWAQSEIKKYLEKPKLREKQA